MPLVELLLDFVAKELDAVVRFVTTPMGVYEFRDELVRNFRVLVNETVRTVLAVPRVGSKIKLLRE